MVLYPCFLLWNRLQAMTETTPHPSEPLTDTPAPGIKGLLLLWVAASLRWWAPNTGLHQEETSSSHIHSSKRVKILPPLQVLGGPGCSPMKEKGLERQTFVFISDYPYCRGICDFYSSCTLCLGLTASYPSWTCLVRFLMGSWFPAIGNLTVILDISMSLLIPLQEV